MENLLLAVVVPSVMSLVAYLIWSVKRSQSFMERLVSNHLAHNTKATEELTVVVGRLNDWLRDQRPH